MYRTREEIENWLNKMSIVKYVINEDLTVDVDFNLNLIGRFMEKIPVKFGIVNGNFDCSWNNLKSLTGCPQIVNGNFNCNDNDLTSLEDCPTKISGDFYCSENKLISLKGCPEEINGSFFCRTNKLTSLQHLPKILNGKVLNIENNNFPEDELVNFICEMKNIEDIFSDFNIDGDKEDFLEKVNYYKSKKENELLKELNFNSNNIKLNKKL